MFKINGIFYLKKTDPKRMNIYANQQVKWNCYQDSVWTNVSLQCNLKTESTKLGFN